VTGASVLRGTGRRERPGRFESASAGAEKAPGARDCRSEGLQGFGPGDRIGSFRGSPRQCIPGDHSDGLRPGAMASQRAETAHQTRAHLPRKAGDPQDTDQAEGTLRSATNPAPAMATRRTGLFGGQATGRQPLGASATEGEWVWATPLFGGRHVLASRASPSTPSGAGRQSPSSSAVLHGGQPTVTRAALFGETPRWPAVDHQTGRGNRSENWFSDQGPRRPSLSAGAKTAR
jgi:hypothetical protein